MCTRLAREKPSLSLQERRAYACHAMRHRTPQFSFVQLYQRLSRGNKASSRNIHKSRPDSPQALSSLPTPTHPLPKLVSLGAWGIDLRLSKCRARAPSHTTYHISFIGGFERRSPMDYPSKTTRVLWMARHKKSASLAFPPRTRPHVAS